MSSNPSPSVVRSQRNNIRRPASGYEIELDAYQDDETKMLPQKWVKDDRPESLDLDSHGKLQLVKPKDHLGYFSTRWDPTSTIGKFRDRLTRYFAGVAP